MLVTHRLALDIFRSEDTRWFNAPKPAWRDREQRSRHRSTENATARQLKRKLLGKLAKTLAL